MNTNNNSKKNLSNLEIANAKLFSKNFSGKQTQFNPEGNRNFCLAIGSYADGEFVIDNELAENLKADGWNIRYLQPRREGDLPLPYVNVKVAFEPFPPKVWLINNTGRVTLTEDTVGTLDWAEIERVDIVVRPRYWESRVGSGSGIKAYLKSAYITIREDKFESQYRNLPDSAQTFGAPGEDTPFDD